MQPQIYNGARCTVSISEREVAAAFVADWSIDTGATEIETIDMVHPAEIAPDRIRVAISLRVYRTPDNDPILGLQAPGRAELGLSEAQKGFLGAKYISLRIKDRNDQTIFYVPRAWLVRRTASMSAGDFLVENWNLKGIGYIGPNT